MTPEEKAKELINKFRTIQLGATDDGLPYFLGTGGTGDDKEAAIICVDEILGSILSVIGNNHIFWKDGEKFQMEYYEKVKLEIYKICYECGGEGTVPGKTGGNEGIPEADVEFVCQECKGEGKIK